MDNLDKCYFLHIITLAKLKPKLKILKKREEMYYGR